VLTSVGSMLQYGATSSLNIGKRRTLVVRRSVPVGVLPLPELAALGGSA
jgi:hypothetical protein